jgi:hypothetical protein
MSKPSRWVFDAAALVAVASAVWMGVAGSWDAAFRFAVMAVLMLAARAADVPMPFAAAFAVFLLLATWAGVQHWYQQVSQFDVLVHFLTPGSLAAVAYFMLVRARLFPAARSALLHLRSWAPVVWVVVVGVSVAVVWEFYEWVVEQVNPAGMSVGYTDTVVDLFAGMLGSLSAGGLVLWWARRHGTERDSTAFRAVA